MAMTSHNSFDTPRGGCPSRLANFEAECMYCAAAIRRTMKHRTCSLCAKEWASAFGPKWFEMDFHSLQVQAHRDLFNGSGRAPADMTSGRITKLVDVDSEAGREIASDDVAEGYAGPIKHPVVYAAIKDILIVAQARDEWSVLSKVANKVRPEQLAQLPAGTIGAAQMERLLVERGFRVRGPGDTERSPLHIPSIPTLERYIRAAKDEIAAGDYFIRVDDDEAAPVDKAA